MESIIQGLGLFELFLDFGIDRSPYDGFKLAKNKFCHFAVISLLLPPCLRLFFWKNRRAAFLLVTAGDSVELYRLGSSGRRA